MLVEGFALPRVMGEDPRQDLESLHGPRYEWGQETAPSSGWPGLGSQAPAATLAPAPSSCLGRAGVQAPGGPQPLSQRACPLPPCCDPPTSKGSWASALEQSRGDHSSGWWGPP